MRFLTLLLLLASSFSVSAGDYPFYYYFTQHTQNQLLYNPAYAGSTNKLNLHLRSMHGLFKVTGTRNAFNILNHGYAAFDRPCEAIHGAWGTYLIIDRPKTSNRYYNLSAGANYAYRLQIKDDHRLQLGAGVNYRRSYIEQEGLIFDPNGTILTGRYSHNFLDFSLGAWYQYKGLNAGISLTHFGNFYVGGKGDNSIGRYDPVFNLYAAYKMTLADKLHLEPYVYLASAGNNTGFAGWGPTLQFSPGFMADYNDAVFVGLGYSHELVISPSVGFQLKKMFRVQGTYNYLINQPDYQRYHNFEVSLTVQLPPKVKEKTPKN